MFSWKLKSSTTAEAELDLMESFGELNSRFLGFVNEIPTFWLWIDTLSSPTRGSRLCTMGTPGRFKSNTSNHGMKGLTSVRSEMFCQLLSLSFLLYKIAYVQVTTEPKMSLSVVLEVVVPETKILGESDIFVKMGSTVQIKCIITSSLEKPAYIFWYHENYRVLDSPGKPQWMDRVSLPTSLISPSP